MQTSKLRQTTENNGGPCKSKNEGTLSVKKRRQVVLTKLQYVTSWEWERIVKNNFQIWHQKRPIDVLQMSTHSEQIRLADGNADVK